MKTRAFEPLAEWNRGKSIELGVLEGKQTREQGGVSINQKKEKGREGDSDHGGRRRIWNHEVV